ncbi:unnamed protein product [Protopolystoma xenopodis]|uniref:S1 motif domain-containing protein n=1 Tax=Protopolystoma xenopodis TaxID=117903 RepID=A0A3S5A810_9PLAT|nr:unnamed protein product [Protopolystoma xenopodis]
MQVHSKSMDRVGSICPHLQGYQIGQLINVVVDAVFENHIVCRASRPIRRFTPFAIPNRKRIRSFCKSGCAGAPKRRRLIEALKSVMEVNGEDEYNINEDRQAEEYENKTIDASDLGDDNGSSQSSNWTAPAFCISANFPDNASKETPAVGQVMPGVIVLLDLAKGQLEVVLTEWFVSGRANHLSKKSIPPNTGQSVASTVLAIRPRDFVIVGLRGHALGRLGVVPARRCFNEFLESNAWFPGQKNHVTIRRLVDCEFVLLAS